MTQYSERAKRKFMSRAYTTKNKRKLIIRIYGVKLMGKLKGKRILVAGSARNIGAKTAQRLVEEGAQVFLGDVDAEQVKAVADQLGAGSQWFDLADQEIGRAHV